MQWKPKSSEKILIRTTYRTQITTASLCDLTQASHRLNMGIGELIAFLNGNTDRCKRPALVLCRRVYETVQAHRWSTWVPRESRFRSDEEFFFFTGVRFGLSNSNLMIGKE
jgi:hypothetical protein